MAKTVLVIDDDANMRWVLKRALAKAGYEVELAANGQDGLFTLATKDVDLVLLDLKMPGVDGLGVLRQVRQRAPDLPVLLLTAYASVPTAVEAMRLGATDYLRKPFDVEEVRFKIARTLEHQAQERQMGQLATRLRESFDFSRLVGHSDALQEVLEQAKVAATHDSPVLIWGERGTGKTLLAQAIHYNGPRPGAPLEVINCAVLSPQALAGELLAETIDLQHSALGRALGGTLILKKVEALSLEMQDGLMAQLAGVRGAEGKLTRLKLVATASENLTVAAKEGRFRDELLELLSAIVIAMPPLRARLDDVPLLVQHLLGERELTPLAQRALLRYEWPGNVTQLERILKRAAALAGEGPIDLPHLPEEIAGCLTADEQVPFRLPPEGIRLEDVERELLRQALAQAHGNKSRAARLLGLSRHTLLYRLEKYGLA